MVKNVHAFRGHADFAKKELRNFEPTGEFLNWCGQL